MSGTSKRRDWQMMASTASKDLKVTFSEYLDKLRVYAKRVILRGGSLTRGEELDKKARMDLLLAIGRGFRLTNKEMAALVLDGTLQEQRRCGCPTCRSRRESNGA